MNNDHTYLLGIDLGTTTTKAALYRADGTEIVVHLAKEMETRHPESGWAEQDMNTLWHAAVSAIKGCLEKSSVDPAHIQALSLSGHGGGVWLVDEDGKPVRPAIIWLDSRSGRHIANWEKEGLTKRIYDICGWNPFPGIGPLTLFPWLVENEKQSLERASFNLTSKDWVKYCLTGTATTDQSMASIAVIDSSTGEYSPELLQMVGVEEYARLLPPIVPSWEVAGYVTDEAARATGLRAGTPVASGGFDGTSAMLGAGCVQDGDASSAIGTAGVHATLSADFNPDPDRVYSLMSYLVPGLSYKTAMTMVAAGNLDWFERELCHEERAAAEAEGVSIYDIINKTVDNRPVGSGGVIYLPFLQGERSPFVQPAARGSFHGLGDWHDRGHLLRSVYEGVAFSTRHNLEALSKDSRVKSLYLTGGGAKSEVWSQLIADCVGTEVLIPDGQDATCRGAAIGAGVAAGVFTDFQEAVETMASVSRVHAFDTDRHSTYSTVFERYKRLIDALMPIWEASADD